MMSIEPIRIKPILFEWEFQYKGHKYFMRRKLDADRFEAREPVNRDLPYTDYQEIHKILDMWYENNCGLSVGDFFWKLGF